MRILSSESLVDLSVKGYTLSPDVARGIFHRWWNETGRYEFSIDRGKITIKQEEAPDFGELSPSQELNDFVNTLVRGE